MAKLEKVGKWDTPALVGLSKGCFRAGRHVTIRSCNPGTPTCDGALVHPHQMLLRVVHAGGKAKVADL